MYDNRAGSEYRARADYVINKYMVGDNVGWQNDESKLRSIATDWEETSKRDIRKQISELIFLTGGKTEFEAEDGNPKLSDFVLKTSIFIVIIWIIMQGKYINFSSSIFNDNHQKK